MEDWADFQEIDLSNPEVNQLHIDTRDFHGKISNAPVPQEVRRKNDIQKMKKYGNRFFFTDEEVKTILQRLFNESGGVKDWRMLMLTGEYGRTVYGWTLKYIRLYKTQMGWVICDAYNKALRREVWESPVDQDTLDS